MLGQPGGRREVGRSADCVVARSVYSGATILSAIRPDCTRFLDITALVREASGEAWSVEPQSARSRSDAQGIGDSAVEALVVDDSTKRVRRVTLAFRWSATGAWQAWRPRKDGADAIAVACGEQVPRSLRKLRHRDAAHDGYEVVAYVRQSTTVFAHVPIVMVTSRVGQKLPCARLSHLGVNEYLGKPYQEKRPARARSSASSRRRNEVPAVDELYSLLVPLGATRLILPRACRCRGRELHPGSRRLADDDSALADRLAGVERRARSR